MIEPNSIGRGALPFGAQCFFFTASWPYTFVATMMIAFYWQDFLFLFFYDPISEISEKLIFCKGKKLFILYHQKLDFQRICLSH